MSLLKLGINPAGQELLLFNRAVIVSPPQAMDLVEVDPQQALLPMPLVEFELSAQLYFKWSGREPLYCK